MNNRQGHFVLEVAILYGKAVFILIVSFFCLNCIKVDINRGLGGGRVCRKISMKILFDLTKSEQLALYYLLKEDLSPKELGKITKLLKTIQEARFVAGLAWFVVVGYLVKHNGKYRSRQRYLCKGCNKTFNDMTNTLILGSRCPGK